MMSELSHNWFVTTAYAVAGFGVMWLVARTWLRHFLARKALIAMETMTSHETEA